MIDYYVWVIWGESTEQILLSTDTVCQIIMTTISSSVIAALVTGIVSIYNSKDFFEDGLKVSS